ncbi:MAG: DASS family sodium-coupled anion symporter [bacterium]|nr:DASS family sodium-coupled anion symporter [bacterium]
MLRHYTAEQRRIAATFVFTVALWATEAFPLGISSLGGMVLLILVAGLDEPRAFSGLGNPIIPLYISSLILAKAMETTGLGRRIALSIMSQHWATTSPARLLFVLICITASISLFLSNTATTAMMLPLALSVLATLQQKDAHKPFAKALMLALSLGACVSVGTPIGTTPDLMAVSVLGQIAGIEIGFGKWMTFGVPITLLLMLTVWCVLGKLFNGEAPDVKAARATALLERQALGPTSHAEKVTLGVLLFAVFFWVVPDVAGQAFGHLAPELNQWIQMRLTSHAVAVTSVLLLFLIPVRGTPSGNPITWKQAAGIDWGVILLLAAGISLGNAIFSCGLAQALGVVLANALNAHTLWSITALGIGAGMLLSEFTSNSVAAAAMLPMIVGLAQSAGVSSAPPVLGTALGVSLGVVFPFSSPTNAMIYGTGLVRQRDMILTGIIIDLVGFGLIFGVLRVALPLLGMA